MAFIGVVAILLYGGLSIYADRVDWVGVTGDEWVTNAALGFLGTGIILHVAIGRRWPAARPRPTHLTLGSGSAHNLSTVPARRSPVRGEP